MVKHLYALAAAKKLLLTAGFNRRFAPMNQRLQQIGPANVLLVQKNRIAADQPVKFAVFDLMTHVVDTTLFLAGIETDAALTCHYQVSTLQGNLDHCSLTLELPNMTAHALMNMHAGANSETAELQNIQGSYRVVDLNSFSKRSPEGEQITTFPDWTPNLQRRGFEPLIKAFVAAVADPAHTNPVSPASSILTHELCQKLVAASTS
ncbi:hypothetical protein [Loigolactobacillus backii]|uniref:Uncharacterized protein n=1 Tax=Loigolactobacillus backii TaxID=375175 RepID=A0A192GYK8_9LACO|nr:hypothetical protein [Loigolactobacillus backii]ANK61604.1 hypothetical protein AYR53_01800 [Loigolactobacillus backii]ANK69196.1 hypothetical protein AYR56_02910 [Loigolactobacillus backii]MDA5388075.1 gfo/Idh/MocA family oxidoreductase [Loigolactobacillus backii]MDA5390567.1 gfo/Idh/MocA family oxidoreductase [Loigolactobacillus backii]